jgi:hypothetical protein
MPDAIAAVFQELVRAYESEDSIESRLAHDADKIETLLQAREYEAQGGHDTAQWQDSSTAALRTDAAKQLAEAILATTPTGRNGARWSSDRGDAWVATSRDAGPIAGRWGRAADALANQGDRDERAV